MNASEKKPTILIVDDSPENVELLSHTFSATYNVLVALSGERMLQLCEENELPDMILLDIKMPKMDGYEAYQHLKASEKTKDIPVIFVTAQTQEFEECQGLEVGAVDYITKPFSPSIILARVRTHLTVYQQKCALRDAYENLQHLENLRDDLVHMIVHDLRNPLMGASGYLEMLKTALMKNDLEKALLYVTRPMDALHKASELINELLVISRLENHAMPLQLSVCDIGELLKETISQHAAGVERIRITQSDASIPICCDSNLVARIISNLLANALKYSPATESIHIDLQTTEQGCRLSFTDKGPGIPREYLEMVFERFYQVEVWRQEGRASSGLGLAFCKLAVERHGGLIGVISTPGQGSTFWFEIPRHQANEDERLDSDRLEVPQYL